jgi:hypothetical protein
LYAFRIKMVLMLIIHYYFFERPKLKNVLDRTDGTGVGHFQRCNLNLTSKCNVISMVAFVHELL